MAARQSRVLAAAGFAVLQIDLHGCGDSAGDHGDASWDGWVGDVVAGARWLRRHHAEPGPLWLWGQRAGALLCVAAAAQLTEPCQFLFWQPTPNGKAVVQQWLRLKAAGELLDGQAKALMAGLRADLAAGRTIEIAGYALGAALCGGLEQATLQPPMPGSDGVRMIWLEISPQSDGTLSPAAQAQAERWHRAGWAVTTELVHGPEFWQTVEIEDAPALLATTLAQLQLADGGGAFDNRAESVSA